MLVFVDLRYLNEFFSPSVANLNPNDELLPLRVCVPEQSVHLFTQNIRRVRR
jgi:hypothetical protein